MNSYNFSWSDLSTYPISSRCLQPFPKTFCLLKVSSSPMFLSSIQFIQSKPTWPSQPNTIHYSRPTFINMNLDFNNKCLWNFLLIFCHSQLYNCIFAILQCNVQMRFRFSLDGIGPLWCCNLTFIHFVTLMMFCFALSKRGPLSIKKCGSNFNVF